jgi:hypothetical protein
VCIALLTSCGGGGDEDGTPPPDPNAAQRVGRGSLTIESPADAATYSTDLDTIVLSGSAFISPTHFRCCSGEASDTGVTVSSSTGSAVSQSAHYCHPLGFGPLSLCDHTWKTVISLRVGDTRVTLEARDPAGNIGRDTITITRRPDTRPPTVSSNTPATGAANVALNTTVRVSFNEAMDAASFTPASFELKDGNGNSVAGAITVAGATATLVPSSRLAPLTSFTATVTQDVRDASGNPLTALHTWSFSTGAAPDTTPPTVVSTSPGAGSSCAGTDAAITASFSESISAASVSASTFNVLNTGNNTPVTGAVSALNATSFSFVPLGGLSFSTTYRATLTNAIRDVAGNAMTADHTWTFATVAAGIGTWRPTSTAGAPLPARGSHSAVWTGSEMIIWGGFQSGPGESALRTGARYRPASDTWVPTNDANAPTPRYSHVAVWTGSEMIVWAGIGTFGELYDGARYNPATDAWRPISSAGATTGSVGLTAVWSGSEMLIFGRGQPGVRYDPATDTWRPMSTPPSGLATLGHSAIWTGSRMIIWGGMRSTFVDTGAAYDPVTDTWEVVAAAGAPSARSNHAGIWTGSEMLVWGGDGSGGALNSGALYNPQTRTWRSMSTCGAAAKLGQGAVWTGSEMMVWGGGRASGQRYDTASDAWRQMSIENAPTASGQYSVVWTGSEMVIWGGGTFGSREGARYEP